MNYRHAYHAGNHADVLKHVVLARSIRHLARKDKPFRVIDAHAGIGLYSLESEQAGKTLEWRDGLGRLYDEAGGRLVLEDDERGIPALAVARNGGGGQLPRAGDCLVSRFAGTVRAAHPA